MISQHKISQSFDLLFGSEGSGYLWWLVSSTLLLQSLAHSRLSSLSVVLKVWKPQPLGQLSDYPDTKHIRVPMTMSLVIII